jgi:uncharacterized oxidoreductase
MRIPMYVSGIQNGLMVPGVAMERLEETAASVHLDARHGLGPVAATEAVGLATSKAAQLGIGCVSLVNGNDLARLGGYLRQPAIEGFVVLMMVNDAGGNPVVAPWGGRSPFLSTNPLAAGIPWREQMPILIDMSTSVVAMGRMKMLAERGEAAPAGWAVDEHGEALIDPTAILAVPRTAALLPLGGDTAGHKGFALSMIVDLLAGGLSGAGCSTGQETGRDQNGVFVVAIDPAKFASRERFVDQVEALASGVKSSPKAPGVEEILMPGERAFRERQQRAQHGIPVTEATRAAFVEILDELGFASRFPLT